MDKKDTKKQNTNEKKQKTDNPHAGHRKRVRERFLIAGLDNFAPHEVIELLLFYGKTRGNVNDTAHRLIERFGSVPGVLEASYDELMSVGDVGEASATLLCLLPHLFRRYSKDKEEVRSTYNSLSALKKFSTSLFIGATVEQLYAMYFDNSLHLLDCVLVAHGTVNIVPMMTRTIVERALEKHASCVVIAHNHPNGVAVPSPEDLNATVMIENALGLFKIDLLEHLLVAGSSCEPLVRYRNGDNHPVLSNGKYDVSLQAFYDHQEDDKGITIIP